MGARYAEGFCGGVCAGGEAWIDILANRRFQKRDRVHVGAQSALNGLIDDALPVELAVHPAQHHRAYRIHEAVRVRPVRRQVRGDDPVAELAAVAGRVEVTQRVRPRMVDRQRRRPGDERTRLEARLELPANRGVFRELFPQEERDLGVVGRAVVARVRRVDGLEAASEQQLAAGLDCGEAAQGGG